MRPFIKSDLRERVEEKIMPEPNTGCWLWSASVNKMGYGTIKIDGRVRLAHRVVYGLFKQAIPDNLCGCHTCDVPSCVNPDHIFIGTMRDNTMDMFKKGRSYDRHCSNNPRAILTNEQALAIREAHTSGVKRRYIQKMFNIPLTTIDDIIYKRSWLTL